MDKPYDNGPLGLLVSNRTEEEARRACAYLIEEFPMAKDGKITCRQTEENRWIVEFPSGRDNWLRYTATIDKMRSAVRDYENGWRAAVEYMKSLPPSKESS